MDRANLDESTEVSLLASVGNRYQLQQLQQAAIILDRSMRKPWERTGRANTMHMTEEAEAGESEEEPLLQDELGDDDNGDLYVSYMTAKARYKDAAKARGVDVEAVRKTAEQKVALAKSKSHCAACGQKGHWHRDTICPKNKAAANNRESKTHSIHVTNEVFELSTSPGGPVLAITDTACSRCVVGAAWLQRYMDDVKAQGDGSGNRPYPYSFINEKESFRFGASRVYESSYAAVIITKVGNAWLAIKAAVIYGDIPLLLSRPLLAALGTVFDIEQNVASFRKIDVEGLKLTSTPSGHPALTVQCGGCAEVDPSSVPKAWGNRELEILKIRGAYMSFVVGHGESVARELTLDGAPGPEVPHALEYSSLFYAKKLPPAIHEALIADTLSMNTFLGWWNSTAISNDFWIETEHKLIRIHVTPRKSFFCATRWQTSKTLHRERLLGALGDVRETWGIACTTQRELSTVVSRWRECEGGGYSVLWIGRSVFNRAVQHPRDPELRYELPAGAMEDEQVGASARMCTAGNPLPLELDSSRATTPFGRTPGGGSDLPEAIDLDVIGGAPSGSRDSGDRLWAEGDQGKHHAEDPRCRGPRPDRHDGGEAQGRPLCRSPRELRSMGIGGRTPERSEHASGPEALRQLAPPAPRAGGDQLCPGLLLRRFGDLGSGTTASYANGEFRDELNGMVHGAGDYAEQGHGTTPCDAEEGSPTTRGGGTRSGHTYEPGDPRRGHERDSGAGDTTRNTTRRARDEDTTRATLKINDADVPAHVNPDLVRPGEHGDGTGGTHHEHYDGKVREEADDFIHYNQNNPQNFNAEDIDHNESDENITRQGECGEGGGSSNYEQGNPQNSNTEDIDFDESGKNTPGQEKCEEGGGFINYNLDNFQDPEAEDIEHDEFNHNPGDSRNSEAEDIEHGEFNHNPGDSQNSEAEDIEHGEFGKNTTRRVECGEGGGGPDYDPEVTQDHNTGGTECNSYEYDVDSGEEELAHAMVVDNFLTGHTRHDPKDCEQRVREAIEGDDYTYKTLEEVMELIPTSSKTKRRQMHGTAEPRARHIFVYYAYGSFGGICRRTFEYPNLVRYLNKFLQAQVQTDLHRDGQWNAISVLENIPATVHTDNNNYPNTANYSTSTGAYVGGELWVQCPGGGVWRTGKGGDLVEGKNLSNYHQAVAIDPKLQHCVEEWEGKRWSLVAFTTRNVMNANPCEKKALRKLEFPIPRNRPEKVDTCASPGSRATPKKSVRKGLWKRAVELSVMLTTLANAYSNYAGELCQVKAQTPEVPMIEIGDVSATCYVADILGGDVNLAEPILWEDYEWWRKMDENVNSEQLWIHVDDVNHSKHGRELEQMAKEQVGKGKVVVYEDNLEDDEATWEKIGYKWRSCGHEVDEDYTEDGRRLLCVRKTKNDYDIYVGETVGGGDPEEPLRTGAAGITFEKGVPPQIAAALRRARQNLGHPSTADFVRHLRVAGARNEVLKAAKGLKCETCTRTQAPAISKPAAIANVLQFNQVVGADLLYVHDVHRRLLLFVPRRHPRRQEGYSHPGTSLLPELGEHLWSARNDRHRPREWAAEGPRKDSGLDRDGDPELRRAGPLAGRLHRKAGWSLEGHIQPGGRG